MAYPVPDFLPGRRLARAGARHFICAAPALAKLPRPDQGRDEARFKLATAPKPLPDLAFPDADDKPLRLSELNGQAVLINFWATWCAPCVKEMPSLDRLQAEMPQGQVLRPAAVARRPVTAQGRAVLCGQEARQSRHLFRQGQEGLGGARRLGPADLDPDRSQGRELGRLEGEADWDKPEALALMKAAVESAA